MSHSTQTRTVTRRRWRERTLAQMMTSPLPTRSDDRGSHAHMWAYEPDRRFIRPHAWGRRASCATR